MKPIARLVVATIVSGSGCVSLDMNFFAPKAASAPIVAKEPAAPPPPIAAGQITETNAEQMLEALREELDFAAGEAEPPAGKKP